MFFAGTNSTMIPLSSDSVTMGVSNVSNSVRTPPTLWQYPSKYYKHIHTLKHNNAVIKKKEEEISNKFSLITLMVKKTTTTHIKNYWRIEKKKKIYREVRAKSLRLVVIFLFHIVLFKFYFITQLLMIFFYVLFSALV
jgi:hypothetical protein